MRWTAMTAASRALETKDRVTRRLARAVHARGERAELVAELARELDELRPWYQPVDLGFGLVAEARDKTGRLHSPTRSFDRGLGKWRSFVVPSLPYDLAGRRVLEVGCNAGMLLAETLRLGAREAVGLELDEHYHRQARFVAGALTRLRGRYVPLRVYRGAMEDVDWPSFGRFDIALMLQVVYHVGRTRGERRLTPDETLAEQAKVVRGVVGISEYVVFGTNPLVDEGYGKGAGSLRAILDAAGVEIAYETSRPHPRGHVIVARGAQPDASFEDAPLERLVSKYFLRAADSPERELADVLLSGGDPLATRYARLRSGTTWTEPGTARLPADLDVPPEYWVVPWAVRPRHETPASSARRARRLPELVTAFAGLRSSLAERGFDSTLGRVRTFKLVHPQRGTVWQYTDGNQRVGAAAHLAAQGANGLRTVPVVVDLEIRRERLLDLPITRQLVDDGRFTEGDVFRWFDAAFDAVEGGHR